MVDQAAVEKLAALAMERGVNYYYDTACRYCTSHCPLGLDIPHLLTLYNKHRYTGGGFIAPMARSTIPADKLPSACISSRSCEAVCPQQLKISEAMTDFSAIL